MFFEGHLGDCPIKVLCKKDTFREENVYINIYEQHGKFMTYSNGCENADGSDECDMCRKNALNKFIELYPDSSK